jgi:hypothetical protein
MRRFSLRPLLIGAALVATVGCASSEEWQIWRSNSAHFASGEHFKFSMRNREGSAARVTRADIELARQQNWFGKAITVSQEQILEK